MKNYSFAILKKLTFILFLVTIISCSEQVTISKNAFVIKNISIIDPIDGFQSVKHVVVEHDLIAMILDKNYKFLANEDKIIDGMWKVFNSRFVGRSCSFFL